MKNLKKPKIQIRNLSKKFGDLTVLDNINLDIYQGEFICVVGPSGCGKTTLLRILGGFESYMGKVLIDGESIKYPYPDKILVFQEFDQLFPWKTVFKNIGFGLNLKDIKDKKKVIQKYINLVGLEGSENKYPHELSGGMKQRVAIARALVMNPSVLLMDEPFGSLDAEMRRNLRDELIQIWQKLKITIVFVTHNVREAVLLADRIVVLSERGKVLDITKVNLPRPHEPTNPEFARIWKKLIGKVARKFNNREMI